MKHTYIYKLLKLLFIKQNEPIPLIVFLSNYDYPDLNGNL